LLYFLAKKAISNKLVLPHVKGEAMMLVL